MEDLFVKYDSSLELKKLGYNEQCFGFWSSKNTYRRFINDSLCNSDVINMFGDEAEEAPAAPTYEQSIDWLLKKINKDKLFDSNKYSISFDDIYYSVILGGVRMFVFTTKEKIVIELIKILKGVDE